MTEPAHAVSALPGAADPSMEDILASIRRILSEDEVAAAKAETSHDKPDPPEAAEEGVLVLDNSMMVGMPSMPEPALPPPPALSPEPVRTNLLAAESEEAAAASVGALMRTLTTDRSTAVHSNGPTIEDLVREGIRPMLKSWLDVHLPPMVERIVRAEIDRITGRAAL